MCARARAEQRLKTFAAFDAPNHRPIITSRACGEDHDRRRNRMYSSRSLPHFDTATPRERSVALSDILLCLNYNRTHRCGERKMKSSELYCPSRSVTSSVSTCKYDGISTKISIRVEPERADCSAKNESASPTDEKLNGLLFASAFSQRNVHASN